MKKRLPSWEERADIYTARTALELGNLAQREARASMTSSPFVDLGDACHLRCKHLLGRLGCAGRAVATGVITNGETAEAR